MKVNGNMVLIGMTGPLIVSLKTIILIARDLSSGQTGISTCFFTIGLCVFVKNHVGL